MTVNVYVHFDGNCEEALTSYAKILNGKIEMLSRFEGSPAAGQVPAPWQKKILHARLNLGDSVIMASDAPPGRFSKPQGFSVCVQVKQAAEAERVFRALSDGGTVTMPFGETFWAVRFGMCVDRFGVPWMVNCEKPAA